MFISIINASFRCFEQVNIFKNPHKCSGKGNALFHPVAQSGKNKLSKERKVDKTTCKSVQSRENNFETIAKLKNNFICQLTWFYPLWNWTSPNKMIVLTKCPHWSIKSKWLESSLLVISCNMIIPAIATLTLLSKWMFTYDLPPLSYRLELIRAIFSWVSLQHAARSLYTWVPYEHASRSFYSTVLNLESTTTFKQWTQYCK